MKKLIIPVFILILIVLISGCANQLNSTNTLPIEGDRIRSTNYNLKNSWLAQPQNPDKAVDVFCLYPTVWARENDKTIPLSSVNNLSMRKNADFSIEKSFLCLLMSPIFMPLTIGNLMPPFYLNNLTINN